MHRPTLRGRRCSRHRPSGRGAPHNHTLTQSPPSALDGGPSSSSARGGLEQRAKAALGHGAAASTRRAPGSSDATRHRQNRLGNHGDIRFLTGVRPRNFSLDQFPWGVSFFPCGTTGLHGRAKVRATKVYRYTRTRKRATKRAHSIARDNVTRSEW